MAGAETPAIDIFSCCQRPPLAIETETSEISLPGDRINTLRELPLEWIASDGVEAHGIGGGLDVARGGPARQRADDSPGGLVPRAGNVAAIAGDVARQLELIAVAGAAQAQGHRFAACIVAAAAANAFARSVLDGNLAGARPASGKLRQRPIGGLRGVDGKGEKACGDCDCGKISCVHDRSNTWPLSLRTCSASSTFSLMMFIGWPDSGLASMVDGHETYAAVACLLRALFS